MKSDLLKGLAALLVANSHLDGIYPYAIMSTGGSLANCIFFALSGYWLAVGFKTDVPPFITWIKKRFNRVYPVSIFVTAIAVLLGFESLESVLDIAQTFFWPTPHWFVAAIVPFYILVYIVLRKFSSLKEMSVVLLALALPYSIAYVGCLDLTKFSIEGEGYFKFIFYFQVMLFGAMVSLHKLDLGLNELSEIKKCSALIFAIVLYFGAKVFLMAGFMNLQFIVHLLSFPIVYILLIMKFDCLEWGAINKALTFFSTISFELYLVHPYVLHTNFVHNAPFPLSLIMFWFVSVFLAYALALLNRAIFFRRSMQG